MSVGAGSAGANIKTRIPHSAVRKYKRIIIILPLNGNGAGGQTHSIPDSGGIVAI